MDIEALFKAMDGFGTNEKTLIRVLAKKDPLQVNSIRIQYKQRFCRDLIEHIQKETSGNFEAALVQIARGPLTNDCEILKRATDGIGTNETMLNDVLMDRSNADINAIKTHYHRLFGRSLESDLRRDLSAATEDMFMMILAAKRAEDFVPVDPMTVDKDVVDLQKAIGGTIVSKDAVLTCQILISRNDAQLRAITAAYKQKFRRDLAEVVEKRFTGHMEKALLLFLARANNRAASDAEQLELTMKGPGTKDELLVQRLVRAHWDRNYMAQVRREYQTRYGKDLVKRIKGETSGDYERLLVACVEP